MLIRDWALPVECFRSANEFSLPAGSGYVYGLSVEERSGHVACWGERCPGVEFAEITAEDAASFRVRYGASKDEATVYLRSQRALSDLWNRIGTSRAYLDITGLPHHVWAPVLAAGVELGRDILAVYAEPVDYRHSPRPTEGEPFDLSERIQGVAPLPGFAFLHGGSQEAVCLIPLLGFEGTRLQHIMEQVQPDSEVFPIIGAPGFRPEYPFYTYQANRAVLEGKAAWRNVHYAQANCPFSLFYLLSDLAQKHRGKHFVLAPIGTKPHALGAVLFAIRYRDSVELVYDHPIRKAKRTEGAARVLVYHVSKFLGMVT